MSSGLGVRSGAGALDAPREHGNFSRLYVSPSDPDKYLRLRRIERICQRFGAALRHLRDARGVTRDVAALEMCMSKGTLEKMEHGDPAIAARLWIRAWQWMGVADEVNQVACAGAESWGAAVVQFRERSKLSQTAFGKEILGRCRSTVEAMEASKVTVRIHFWLTVWKEMGLESAVIDAAIPAKQTLAQSAEAAALRPGTAEPPAID